MIQTFLELCADIKEVNDWLNSIKLLVNVSKTVQMNIRTNNKTSNSAQRFSPNSAFIENKPERKYLGVTVDSKLAFLSHIQSVREKLSKQSGLVSKLRHFVPRAQLIDYYKTCINPIIKYGVLVYAWCSYTTLLPIFTLQKRSWGSFTSEGKAIHVKIFPSISQFFQFTTNCTSMS